MQLQQFTFLVNTSETFGGRIQIKFELLRLLEMNVGTIENESIMALALHKTPWASPHDEIFTAAKSQMLLWYPAPEFVCTRIEGRFHLIFADALMLRFDKMVRSNLRPVICHDWGDVTSYDVKVQASFTKWALEKNGVLDSVHIFAKSPMLRLGIKVSNVAVGGIMSVYSSRESLQQAAHEKLSKHTRRNPKFSTGHHSLRGH